MRWPPHELHLLLTWHVNDGLKRHSNKHHLARSDAIKVVIWIHFFSLSISAWQQQQQWIWISSRMYSYSCWCYKKAILISHSDRDREQRCRIKEGLHKKLISLSSVEAQQKMRNKPGGGIPKVQSVDKITLKKVSFCKGIKSAGVISYYFLTLWDSQVWYKAWCIMIDDVFSWKSNKSQL